MGKIVVFENITLDGVVQDPTGEEGFSAVDWRTCLTANDREAWNRLILEDALTARALLLGRKAYEFFAARYPTRTGPLADTMNALPKYVVSSASTDLAWNNSEVLKGEVVESISRLVDSIDGEIRVYASSRLVHTLIEQNLVDELRLAIFPLMMGAGNRLLDRTGEPRPLRPAPLRLAETRTIGDDLTHLAYRRC
jgi:dihydrofolate reductase